MFLVAVAVLLTLADGAQGPPQSFPATTVVPFRTDAAPRIDPVFGDVASFRAAIDRFLSLQGEMDRVRDDFSSAVHVTLAALAEAGATTTLADSRQCPPSAGLPYARALASGGRYLGLGQQLQTTYRTLRRGDDLGDTLGLTPDYRLKVKKAKDLHQQLLSDYREMRVAFYDQLGAEMRHAGCKLTAKGVAPPPNANPSDPGAWEMADPIADVAVAAGAPRANGDAAPATATTRAAAADAPAAMAEASAADVAPAIWIEVDNSLCNEPTRLSIDGQVAGDIGARNKTSVRARSGPHEVCALPTSDRRACGDTGTVRKAYLHEGWRLTIHCASSR